MNKVINFASLSQFPRTNQVLQGTIPFAQGEWNGDIQAWSDDEHSQVFEVVPFGRPYKDGSRRFGLACGRVTMEPHQNARVELAPLSAEIPGEFSFGQGLGTMQWKFGLHVQLADNSWREAQFFPWTEVERTGHRLTLTVRKRIPGTPFVAMLTVYFATGQDTARYELVVIGSDPSVSNVEYPIKDLRLEIDGAFGTVFSANERGVETLKPFQQFRLMSNTHFGDGQGQMWFGMFANPDPANEDQVQIAAADGEWPTIGMSADWHKTQALGCELFGVVAAPLLPVPDGGVTACHLEFQNLYNRRWKTPGDVWGESAYGVTKTPGQTGGQQDFGLINFWEAFYFGRSEFLPLILDCATEEWKRPGHYCEEDGSAVVGANHPDWLPYSGVTHFHPGVGSDKLGKATEGGWYSAGDTHGWKGKDWQHHTSNMLHAALVLTRSLALQVHAEYEIECLVHGRTTEDTHRGWSTTTEAWQRGFGRPCHTLLCLDTVVPDDRIVPHETLRATGVEPTEKSLLAFIKTMNPNWSGLDKPTYGHTVIDGRIQAPYPGYTSWQDGLLLKGLLPLLDTLDEPLSADMQKVKTWAYRSASSLVRHATICERDANGKLVSALAGHGIRVLDDGSSPLKADGTLRDELDPAVFVSGGWGLTIWCLPAYEWIATDDGMANFDPIAQARAQEIVELLREQRVPTYYGTVVPERPALDYGLRWTTETETRTT